MARAGLNEETHGKRLVSERGHSESRQLLLSRGFHPLTEGKASLSLSLPEISVSAQMPSQNRCNTSRKGLGTVFLNCNVLGGLGSQRGWWVRSGGQR